MVPLFSVISSFPLIELKVCYNDTPVILFSSGFSNLQTLELENVESKSSETILSLCSLSSTLIHLRLLAYGDINSMLILLLSLKLLVHLDIGVINSTLYPAIAKLPHLRSLKLSLVTDDLDLLLQLPYLESLCIFNVNLTQSICEILRSLQELRVLRLSKVHTIEESSFITTLLSLSKLKALQISYFDSAEFSIELLVQVNHLEELILYYRSSPIMSLDGLVSLSCNYQYFGGFMLQEMSNEELKDQFKKRNLIPFRQKQFGEFLL
jgi:hypothetical protein